jgi:hypothetical protein
MAAVLLAYLAFAHSPRWTVYYVEVEVVPPFLVALGAWTIVTAARVRRWWPARDARAAMPPGVALAGLVLAVPVAVTLLQQAPNVRVAHLRAQDLYRRIHRTVAALPGERKVVFVRYAPYHVPHFQFVANDADLATSPTWWVHDRGAAENARLRALAPDRAAYVLDEELGWIGPVARARAWEPRPELPAGTPIPLPSR